MTRYQSLAFVEIENVNNKRAWSCQHVKTNAELGIIKWFHPFAQYVYTPSIKGSVYTLGYIKHIAHFINNVYREEADANIN